MLNPPIESDWKNDTIKKNEKCIFKTISATSKENPKSIITKKIFLNKILKQKTSEKIKGKKKFDLMDKNLFEQKIKRERKIKINDPFLYELISANKDCILLKRKKFREQENQSSFEMGKILEKKDRYNIESKKIKKNKNLTKNEVENILDFDRILEEVLEEKLMLDENKNLIEDIIVPIVNINNKHKIKIETKFLIKGKLINKLRKKDHKNIKQNTPKELYLNQKIEKIENGNLIKIPNFAQNIHHPKKLRKEKSIKSEIIKIKNIKDKKLLENSNTVVKRIVKNLKGKIKKIKKRTQRRDSNLYDINNFVVQNNANKINERKDIFDIPIPVYRELEENFYELSQIDKEENNSIDINDEINDEVYLKFHNVYEKREFDFRINFYKKKNQKQKCESFTPQENTSIHESNTIDSVIRINCNFLQEEGFLAK